MTPLTPAQFALALIATATDFVGLAETQENAAWDDPATAASEREKSNLLKLTMSLCGWEPGQPYCAAFAGAMVTLTARKCGLALTGS